MSRLTPERQIRYARILGLAFCVAGFAVIFIGWNGTARRAAVDTQFPYLISGGVGGIALVVFGLGLLMVAQIRAERMRLTTVMDLLGERLTKQAKSALDEAASERAPKKAEPFVMQVRYARMFSLAIALAGFLAIFLGWNGAARFAAVDQQVPYLLSGGAAGLGLIVLAVGLLVIAQIRTDRRKLMNVLEVMAVAVRKAGMPEAEAVTTAEPSAAPPTAAAANGWVVAGPSTYHRPGCRLVEGKELDRVRMNMAQASGLSPCRVCKPEEPDAVESAADGDPADASADGKTPAGTAEEAAEAEATAPESPPAGSTEEEPAAVPAGAGTDDVGGEAEAEPRSSDPGKSRSKS